jgi:hypothetical protein
VDEGFHMSPGTDEVFRQVAADKSASPGE